MGALEVGCFALIIAGFEIDLITSMANVHRSALPRRRNKTIASIERVNFSASAIAGQGSAAMTLTAPPDLCDLMT